MHLLRRLNRDQTVSMVMATHDVELAPLFCDRIALLREGRLVTVGTPAQVFTDTAALRESGMRLPRIGHLMEILNKSDGLSKLGNPMTIGEARKALNELLLVRQRSS
jgi:ABC-type glutathione transport system ATPase component